MKILLANFAKMVGATGGLAKVTCNFANEMLKRGHDVYLIYCDEKQGDFFYHIDGGVKAYNLNLINGKLAKMPWYMKLKREALRGIDIRKARAVNDDFIEKYMLGNLRNLLNEIKPDVIVASQPLSSMILLTDLKVKMPVVNMSHGEPEDYFHTYPVKQVEALEKCAVNQVLMPSFKEAITRRFPDNRVEVIGNVVPQYELAVNLSIEKSKYKMIFVGQLTKRKQPHLAIKAFAQIADKYPEWILELWGAEDKKKYTDEINKMIFKSGLQDRILLKGTTSDVEGVLAQSDIFVFPSAAEGFGLSLAEAMSKGLPVLGYRSCPAVNELIKDGKNGFLCDNGIDDLAEKMSILMKDRDLRCKFGKNGREDMKQYASENIWNQWENLIRSLF